MSQSLNELFNALVQSEQAADAEKNKYQEAKKNIQLYTERLENETTKETEITTEIQNLETNLEGLETSIEEITHHKTFLEESVRQIYSENLDKINEIASMREKRKAQALQLMKQVQEFSAKYGLSSNTREKRLESARSNLKKVTVQEMEALEQEIEEKKTKIREINELLARREKLATANEKLSSVENDMQVGIRDEDSKIRQLQRDNLTLKMAPESGDEFLQVNEDLDKYRTDQLENRAENLHTQLSSITEDLRRQEGQTLRLQFRKWQRVRQQQQIPRHADTQQQQQENAEPATDFDTQNQLEDCPNQITFQTHPDMTSIEISPDGNKTAMSGNTDRPGFGMSAQRDVLSQNSKNTNDIVMTSPSRNLLTPQAGLSSYQHKFQSYPDYEKQDCVRDKNQELENNIEKATIKTGSLTSHQACTHNQELFSANGKKSETATCEAQYSAVENTPPPELKLIFSQDDILCPSASTVSETAARSNKESLDGTSQNTIFISSPL